MKGLQQAVNIRRWPGNGEPAKAWGKLKQDPELWDEKGDTLIFFGHGRADPSFRIHSSLLRETGSDVLVDMLLYGTVRSYGNIPGISQKIYLDPPADVTAKTDVLRFHITTRNFIAFLLKRPLVGMTFYQALVDLHERLEEYMPIGTDCISALKTYLVGLGLVNVSNEPRATAGLLAWSEDVRWNEGWREAFVHSVGMYEQLQHLEEAEDISTMTRAHMNRAHLELQVRIHEAEDCLSTWYFDDAHFAQEDMPPTVRQTSDRFRKFLKCYYEKEYLSWPVKRPQQTGDLWLERKLIVRLQQDFGALYEYCVDRSVTWNGDCDSGLNHKNKKNLVKIDSRENFWLDGEDDRMLHVFRNLDCRLNTENIPYPYPILPASVPAPQGAKKRPTIFGKDKRKDTVRESRLAHAYAAASNASLLYREQVSNDLVRSFIRFEKTDQTGYIDPREARRERWIIIYCILQTLAGISVDVPNLSFKDNVDYFLNARLEGLPPWCPEERVFAEVSREFSHCWTSPLAWADDSYEQRATSRGTRPSTSQKSLDSEFSSEIRPLIPDADGSSYGYADTQPSVVAASSSLNFCSSKYQGSHPASFIYLESKSKLPPQQTTPAYLSSLPLPMSEKDSERPPSSDPSEPFHNLFEPDTTASNTHLASVPDLSSVDGTSEYDSLDPTTDMSSVERNSSTDRSSVSQRSDGRKSLSSKFVKMAGIEEHSTMSLPMRSERKGSGLQRFGSLKK